ncbi:hypothetical protein ACPOL_0467 [Acidisarcina polymorpha]|uniref:Uncharacterized protein n=1 Tax=Acidisarcina polymorpha TaxID=2211140 RepID=A0A2Z5FTM6_9BACT|nr:hypothetical protein ACPOL_0467 [Acidisarcina polymorpha]
MTAAALFIHGYHLGVDDSGIYLPAVKRIIDPRLYPFGADFFEAHARLSQFAAVIGWSARVTHLTADFTIFLWYTGTVFAFLLACWQLASVCFDSPHARWSALLSMTGLLTLPAAGTALVLMDPFLTARSASTPLTIFALTACLSRRPGLAFFWIILATLVHPLMAVYTAALLAILLLSSRRTAAEQGDSSARKQAVLVGSLAPQSFNFAPVSPEYRRVLDMRSFLFLSRWRWFEWAGLAVPMLFLFWTSRNPPRGATSAYGRLAQAATILGVVSTLTGCVFSASSSFDNFARLQPLRTFQLIYIVFFILLGGVLGEYVLERRYWLWIGTFAALWIGMFLLQRSAYPNSRHLEWPGATPANPWVAAFLWVRSNTPLDAVFALDPDYIALPGEDSHVFRAIAERSALTDVYKDAGVVSLFPQLAPEWSREQQAQQGWKQFQLVDFQRLAEQYPVTWVIVQGLPAGGLVCPYRNAAVAVCRIPGAAGLGVRFPPS